MRCNNLNQTTLLEGAQSITDLLGRKGGEGGEFRGWGDDLWARGGIISRDLLRRGEKKEQDVELKSLGIVKDFVLHKFAIKCYSSIHSFPPFLNKGIEGVCQLMTLSTKKTKIEIYMTKQGFFLQKIVTFVLLHTNSNYYVCHN